MRLISHLSPNSRHYAVSPPTTIRPLLIFEEANPTAFFYFLLSFYDSFTASGFIEDITQEDMTHNRVRVPLVYFFCQMLDGFEIHHRRTRSGRSNFFEAIHFQILDRLLGVKDTTIHGYINPRWEQLNQQDRTTDIKWCIRYLKGGRLHSACQDDHLLCNLGQYLCGLDYGIGTMGNHDMTIWLGVNLFKNKPAVAVVKIKAIFFYQRFDLIINGDIRLGEYLLNGGITNNKVTFLRGVILVYRSPSGENLYFHLINKPQYIEATNQQGFHLRKHQDQMAPSLQVVRLVRRIEWAGQAHAV